MAHVTAHDNVNDEYSVYFVECSTTLHHVPRCDVREIETRYPTRREMIGKDFFFDGAPDLPEGMWRVRRLINQNDGYECCRITGSRRQNIKKFDIGYVMKQYMKEIDDNRGRVTTVSVLSTRFRHS